MHPKKPFRPISPSSPSSEQARLQKPTVLTVPLSLECSSVSRFPPLTFLSWRRNSSGLWRKSAKIASESVTIAFILLWEQTRHPFCRDFFHSQFFLQNLKHCTLRYAWGLNYFTHFDSSTTQNHIIDFLNHFVGSQFIYLIVNSCKHRSRCSMNCSYLSCDLFRC